jgi:hypothetical protein
MDIFTTHVSPVEITSVNPPDYILAHLTGGREMSSEYILWYMHDETRISGPVPGQYLNPVVIDATTGSTEQGGGTKHGGSTEQGGNIHDVRVDINSQPQIVNEGAARGDALKYCELLRTAEKPLH